MYYIIAIYLAFHAVSLLSIRDVFGVQKIANAIRYDALELIFLVTQWFLIIKFDDQDNVSIMVIKTLTTVYMTKYFTDYWRNNFN